MEFDETTFGKLNADDYDELHDPGTTEESVALIAELAGGGKLLEFAIGTGRVALPLAARGLEIAGIEGSPEMVEKMREKPGGEAITVTIGDMASARAEGNFDFTFLIFNTLFNLTTQDAQVRCFQNAADHLNPGGAFLVETFVPHAGQWRDQNSIRTMQVGFKSAWIEAATHDPITQRVDMQRIRITEDGMKLVPLQMRYAWPQEIDLMAKLAGMKLEERWGGWQREPFTTGSKMHVSLYRKTGE